MRMIKAPEGDLSYRLQWLNHLIISKYIKMSKCNYELKKCFIQVSIYRLIKALMRLI